jgi:hypothetical protein
VDLGDGGGEIGPLESPILVLEASLMLAELGGSSSLEVSGDAGEAEEAAAFSKVSRMTSGCCRLGDEEASLLQ